jgi:hypothetical protein
MVSGRWISLPRPGYVELVSRQACFPADKPALPPARLAWREIRLSRARQSCRALDRSNPAPDNLTGLPISRKPDLPPTALTGAGNPLPEIGQLSRQGFQLRLNLGNEVSRSTPRVRQKSSRSASPRDRASSMRSCTESAWTALRSRSRNSSATDRMPAV